MGNAAKMPLVIVIIATFNSPITLQTTISSLLGQDFVNFEAWIIGDCCTDESEKIVFSFKDERLNWVNLSKNSGSQAIPNNEGLKRAKGQYIAYLGHDDIWFPNHLSTLIENLESQNADFVYCLSAMLSRDGNHVAAGQIDSDIDNAKRFLKRGVHIPPSSWLYKKSITEECGYWANPDEVYSPVDVEYLRRIIEKNKKMSFAENLFIVKFPSPWWGLYAMKDHFPQQHYLDLINQDPKLASVKVLTELANAHGKQYNQVPIIRQSLRLLLKSCFHFFSYQYSYDKYPLKQLLILKNRYERKRNRKKRGLSK